MRRFIYFLPNVGGCPDVKKLRECGVGYAFPVQGASVETYAGPHGQTGMLVAAGDGADLCYDQTRQRWAKLSDRAWVGMFNDPTRTPGPQDLRRREKSLDGQPVELADGNLWDIPAVRFANGDSALPRIVVLGDDNLPAWRVIPEFNELSNLVHDLKEQHFTGAPRYTPADLMHLGGLALQANYRIGPVETAMLGLLTTDNCRQIARVLLDADNLEKLIDEFKKKVPDAFKPGSISKAGSSA